jgi:hypothetical protein
LPTKRPWWIERSSQSVRFRNSIAVGVVQLVYEAQQRKQSLDRCRRNGPAMAYGESATGDKFEPRRFPDDYRVELIERG